MQASPGTHGSVSVVKRRRKWWLYGASAAGLLVVIVVVWYFAEVLLHALKLPSADNVLNMKATLLRDIDNETEFKEFTVPDAHVPKILSALAQAERDSSPAKWVVAGHLDLECKDGNTYRIDLYWSHKPVGAFSVHRRDGPRNPGYFVSNYFRGGSDQALREAITAAHAAYQADLKGKQPKSE
jgi:hypothetical protein